VRNSDGAVGRVTDQIDTHFPAEVEFFLSSTASITALGPSQPTVRWVLVALLPGINWPRHEADQLPFGAQIKNACSSTATLPCLHIVICN